MLGGNDIFPVCLNAIEAAERRSPQRGVTDDKAPKARVRYRLQYGVEFTAPFHNRMLRRVRRDGLACQDLQSTRPWTDPFEMGKMGMQIEMPYACQ